MRKREAVSLSYELADLLEAIEGARLHIWNLQETPSCGTPNPARVQLEASSAATLALVASRMRLLRRVLAGELDPAIVLSDHNAIAADDSIEDRDLRLLPWSPTEVRQHAEAELEETRGRRGGR